MSSLTFMMGEFAAEFPTDRQYAKNHMWAKPAGQGSFQFGFSAYAVRLLQDVYFLDWVVDAGAVLAERVEIGAIESKKAESDLFAPIAGTLIEFNQVLLKDTSLINVDKYNRGWLFTMRGDGAGLLSAKDYLEHLEAVWEVTQRTIKGQLNS
jgi:glycine cleavage system H protein